VFHSDRQEGMITDHAMQPGYDYPEEFESGLDLILDGLARLRTRSYAARTSPRCASRSGAPRSRELSTTSYGNR
jgi:hypothetical protein